MKNSLQKLMILTMLTGVSAYGLDESTNAAATGASPRLIPAPPPTPVPETIVAEIETKMHQIGTEIVECVGAACQFCKAELTEAHLVTAADDLTKVADVVLPILAIVVPATAPIDALVGAGINTGDAALDKVVAAQTTAPVVAPSVATASVVAEA